MQAMLRVEGLDPALEEHSGLTASCQVGWMRHELRFPERHPVEISLCTVGTLTHQSISRHRTPRPTLHEL